MQTTDNNLENKLYDYTPSTRRPKIEWPNGARVAIWVGVNIEHYELGKPSTSLEPALADLVLDPLNHGWRDYGVRVGVFRLMDLLDDNGIRASALLNSDVCHYYPEIIDEGRKRRWVWLAHGKNNSILQAGMSLRKERQYLKDVVRAIKRGTGQQPKGWLGPALTETPNTTNILAQLGISYTCDWCNDDQPYPMKVKSGRMISVPYSVETNDIEVFVTRCQTGEEYLQAVKDQFDQLYEEGASSGKVMSLPIHPFVVNQPLRHKYLARALDYILSKDKVWATTSDEIADFYFERYYDSHS